MSLLLELAVSAIGSLTMYGGAHYIKEHFFGTDQPESDGSYRWKNLYYRGVFNCPKCGYNSDRRQPPICACKQYASKTHYHYQCQGSSHACGFSCILRTKDDID